MAFRSGLASSSSFIFRRPLVSPFCLVTSASTATATLRVAKISRHGRFRGGGGSCFLATNAQQQQQQQQPNTLSSSKKETTKTSKRLLLPPDKRKLLQVAILGPPNAGKSTLFNRLLDKESNKTYRLKSENAARNRSSRTSKSWQNYQGGNAIVSNVPGTTRDRREGIGRIGTCYFWMMDTAGVNGERLEQRVLDVAAAANNKNRNVTVVHHDDYRNTRANHSAAADEKGADKDGEIIRRRMVHSMIQQALLAARQADIIFVMFDARQTGVTSDILEICRWLRKEERGGGGGGVRGHNNSKNSGKSKVILLANKLENEHHWDYKDDSPVLEHLDEAARTGFDVLPISAQHGDGMADIANVIEEVYLERRERQLQQQQQQQQDGAEYTAPLSSKQQDDPDNVDANDDDNEKPLQLAILGRPNVGKSTCELQKRSC
jgi:predicted GTPase